MDHSNATSHTDVRRTSAGSEERRTGDAIAISGDYQYRARTQGFVVQRFWHAEKERVIRKFSPPRPTDRVLDVGCGSGVVTDVLASFGCRTTGIDGNEAAIKFAQRTFVRTNLDFRRALVEDLDFESGSLDRIYCFELIEHIFMHQVNTLLSTCRQLVRPGGVLTLTTPNFGGLWPVVELTLDRLKLAPTLDNEQHVTHFTRRSLRRALQGTGWRVERLTTFSTFAPFLSVAGWNFAGRVAELEDALALPFGNILLAVARKA